MSQLMHPEQFSQWLHDYLPRISEGEPATLFMPAVVSDPTDGLIAHLHGLNLSRAFCWSEIHDALPADDPRIPPIQGAVRRHTDASLAAATGGEYMLEHWLACYAVLLLT